ncbi:MAG TPA: dihydrofolate reductase [Acidimicrobiia bacterium]
MRTVIVAAVGRNGVIGIDGRLPWSIPDDLARFKRITMGGALVMGRATFESIRRPLPGRTNIVLTRNDVWSQEGVEVAGDLDAALEIARARDKDAFVVGGSEVFQAALDVTDVLELTEVDASPEGDTWFPSVDWSKWRETARETHEGFSFVTYERT